MSFLVCGRSPRRITPGLTLSRSCLAHGSTQLEKRWKQQPANTSLDRSAVIELAIEALSSVCATDFKSGEIEIGICSSAEEEPVPEGVAKGEGLFRQMGEEERGEWLVRVGEKD